MKKIVLLIVALVSINSFSQTEKGKILIGAHSNLGASSFNFSFKTDDTPSQKYGSSKGFSFSPNVGFFILDNFALGLDLSLSFSSSSNVNSNIENGFNTSSIGPFAKYYLLKDKFRPFLMVKYSIGRSKNTQTDQFGNENSYKSSLNSLNAGAGAAYFINNYLSFEFSIDYTRNVLKSIDNNPSNSRNISSGITSSIGLAIFL